MEPVTRGGPGSPPGAPAAPSSLFIALLGLTHEAIITRRGLISRERRNKKRPCRLVPAAPSFQSVLASPARRAPNPALSLFIFRAAV